MSYTYNFVSQITIYGGLLSTIILPTRYSKQVYVYTYQSPYNTFPQGAARQASNPPPEDDGLEGMAGALARALAARKDATHGKHFKKIQLLMIGFKLRTQQRAQSHT